MGFDGAEAETGPGYPLLQALVDFREVVSQLVDEQKQLVLSRGSEPAEPRTPTVPASGGTPPVDRPIARKPVPRSFVREEPTIPVVDAKVSPPERIQDGPPQDSRQRLDALARLLDRRLKPDAPETNGKS